MHLLEQMQGSYTNMLLGSDNLQVTPLAKHRHVQKLKRSVYIQVNDNYFLTKLQVDVNVDGVYI